MKTAELLQKIIEILFPVPCIFCASCSGWICRDCLNSLEFVDQNECPLCRKTQSHNNPCNKCKTKTNISKLLYLFEYEHEIKKLVKLLKYKKYYSLRFEFAYLLRKFLLQKELLTKQTLITFAPSSPSSIKKRGFNHMQQIAQMLRQLIPTLKSQDIFLKAETSRQATLDKKQRRLNLKDKISLLQGIDISTYQKIIILDDLATTGATLNECCKVIRNTLPGIDILCIAIARPTLLSKAQPPSQI